MSPSKFDSHKFESLATGSPSKFSAPSRKMRNQPANRIHDIEFAAEISTSLITQVRNLQALLQERDEEVKDLKSEKAGLEVEVQGFQQRMRNLDESESRYKDENWTLETQIQEFIAGQKEAADREKKLSHALNALQADKNATQRELDEIRAAHTKLAEDHAAAVKHHDIELGTAKRNAVLAEGERAAMQRKIDELTLQNQELAKAISVERGRTSQRNSPAGSSEDDAENASGNLTPEHSPPPSPIKPTPRHAMLETETLKTSLQHAQRTIQSLRSNVHREKTEKLDLKRLLQEARDELEKLRSDPVERPHQKRAREAKSREFKKPAKLGTARAIKAEILEDPEWEDASVRGPPLMLARMTGQADIPIRSTETDEFETANEAHESTDAFETAHERNGTETEAFQTGLEDFDSDDTEMESPSARAGANRANALKKAAVFVPTSKEYSYESTASTSASEDEDYMGSPTRTPNSQPRRVRMRTSHGHFARRSRQFSGDQTYQGSPASQISHTNRSFSSTNGLPRQSLFAELGELDGSDEDSTVGTPGQRSLRSVTPASTARGINISPRSNVPPVPAMPRVIMVDSGTMTEPVSVLAASEQLLSMDSAINDGQIRPSSVIYTGAGTQREPHVGALGQDDTHAKSPMTFGGLPAPVLAPPQHLSVSSVYSEQVEPQAPLEPEAPQPPKLALSNVFSEHVEPVSEPAVAPPTLSMSGVQSEEVKPAPVPPPRLGFSGVSTEHVVPVTEPEVPPPNLSMSSVAFEAVEPVVEPVILPTLSVSSIFEEHIEPIAEEEKPLPPPPALAFSAVSSAQTEPIAEPEVEPRVVTVVEYRDAPQPPPATLGFSSVSTAQTEPIAEPEVKPRVVTVVEYRDAPQPPPAALGFSSVSSAETEPIAEVEQEPRVVTMVEYRDAPKPPPATLAFSSVSSAETEPIPQPEAAPRVVTVVEYRDAPQPPPAALNFSALSSAESEPVAGPEVEPHIVTVVEYRDAPAPPPADLTFTGISSAEVVPVAEPEREPEIVRVIEHVEAPRPPPAPLSFSPLVSEGVEPQAEPIPLPPTLSVSSVATQDIEPQPEAEVPQPTLSVSNIFSEHIEPQAESPVLPPTLSVSRVVSEHVEPVSPVANEAVSEAPALAAFDFSSIQSLDIKPTEPKSPAFGKALLPALGFSAVETLDTEPASPRSPKRNGFIIPRDETAQNGIFGTTTARGIKVPEAILIAEDETRGSSHSPSTQTADSQTPFKEISGNTDKNLRTAAIQTSDSSAQTSLTAEIIDQILHSKHSQSQPAYHRSDSIVSSDHLSTTGTVRIHRSHDSLNHNARSKDIGVEPISETVLRRPGSAASARSPTKSFPPLPSNHREVIEAARTGTANSGHGTIGSMGPPLFPASAYKNPINRPRTPASVSSKQGEQATRPERLGTAEIHSPTRLAPRSRKSSVSSFASEVDHRFNMASGMMGMAGHGFGPNTDPRMIQAITQTMIGEYLWKYTRKTGRGEMSEKRHRRYFWVHPYTRTLYWSDRDPTSAGRSELRAKSVPIEAVRVVTDDNPMPPGLHRKSLIIVAPGRSVKFTCTTGQRHETWFNALSYLLLRTEGEGQADTEEIVNGLTREDVEEFNPSHDPRGASRAGPRGAPSIASYNSRVTMQSAASFNLEVPTLTPNHKKAVSTSSVRPSIAGRISGYWKSTQDSLSMRSRSGVKDQLSLYSNNEVHDSAEDLREMYERQDQESDRLDNVRACCDGKFQPFVLCSVLLC